jgi:2-polyprenyl-3-methyl-5-hydroxy-6-metoxy-1,4-benzoquinol methylase
MTADERRFEFGDNWSRFLGVVDENRINGSVTDIQSMLGRLSLDGETFLDVGSGSGLSSLAAVRLGARRVVSFDYDEESVAATTALKARFAPDADWSIGRGDATDSEYMSGLGTFDVVYSWGVLHHTGAMWEALENTCAGVSPGGTLLIAIYNDQGPRSKAWRAVKRLYNRLPPSTRAPYAVGVMLPTEARMLASATARGRPGDYIRGWTHARERGMSRWHDLLDWVGGYPFEVATPEEVFRFCRDRGFELRELRTCGGGLGCNQFVFRRHAEVEVPINSS